MGYEARHGRLVGPPTAANRLLHAQNRIKTLQQLQLGFVQLWGCLCMSRCSHGGQSAAPLP